MCINCFKAEVDAKCNAATLAELELALAALPAQAAQFLQVQFGVALAGCADLEPGVSAQKKQTNRQRAAHTIATDWIGQKARAHLRGRLAEVGIGERSMAAGVAPADRDLDRVCRMLMTPRLNEQDLVDRIVQSRAGLHDIAAPATHHMTQDLSDSDPDE